MPDKELAVQDDWNVTVDSGSCVGSGMCVAVAAKLFATGPDGKAVVLRAETGQDPDVLDAADLCPGGAIIVTDAATGQEVDPPTS
jgi:ferredoxin